MDQAFQCTLVLMVLSSLAAEGLQKDYDDMNEVVGCPLLF